MANYIVSSGEVSSNLVINNGDRLEILSGGSILNTVVNRGGNMFIQDGGVASGIITSSGYVVVSSGGTMFDADLSGGGDYVIIQEGGILSSAIVRDALALNISGSAYNIVLSRGKGNGDRTDLIMCDGGYAENVILYDDTYLFMAPNATINGLVFSGTNFLTSVYAGAKIDNLVQVPFTKRYYSIPAAAIVSYDTNNLSGVY